MNKIRSKSIIIGVVGSAIVAFGMYNVHDAADITEGGVLGLNLLLEYWLDISPAYTNFVLTALCFALGWKALGRGFVVYSLIFTTSFSVFYRVLELFTPRLFPRLAYTAFPHTLFSRDGRAFGADHRNNDDVRKKA